MINDPEAPATGKAVLLVHRWTGLGDNEKMRARMLAELGDSLQRTPQTQINFPARQSACSN